MPDQIEGYTFTSDRQAVVDAATGVIPKDQWKHLPLIAKMLLVVVLVLRNKQRYCDDDGFLTLTFPDLLRVLGLTTVNAQAMPIREAMMRRGLYVTNDKPGRKNRLKLLANPDVQACLDDLADYDRSNEG